MSAINHLEEVKERLKKLKYEAIDLEQILILLTSLETRKNSIEHA